MPQRSEEASEVRLSKHHYTEHLIKTGLATFQTKPSWTEKTTDGDTVIAFASETDTTAVEFANYLIAVRQQTLAQGRQSQDPAAPEKNTGSTRTQ